MVVGDLLVVDHARELRDALGHPERGTLDAAPEGPPPDVLRLGARGLLVAALTAPQFGILAPLLAGLQYVLPNAEDSGLPEPTSVQQVLLIVALVNDDEGTDQSLPKVDQGEPVNTLAVDAEEKETKPPRRYSDASLLGAMETAGKLVDDEAAREAMKESGIGTPATRAAIIERLIDVGYVERDGRSLVTTEKGLNVVRLLGEHPLTSPQLTGDWEARLAKIEEGDETRKRFMADIEKFAGATVGELDAKLKDVKIPRATLGPCPVCGNIISENRKGYSCWSREDPGCGFVIWKAKASKNLPVAVAKELITTGRTAKAVTGFKGRSGKSFRAKLALQQSEDGKWRVEFDAPWAKEGAKPPEEESAETPATDTAAAADATAAETAAA